MHLCVSYYSLYTERFYPDGISSLSLITESACDCCKVPAKVCKVVLTCVRIPLRVILEDKLTLGQVSVQVLPFRFVVIIPPMLHTHLHLNNNILRRTNGRSLGSCKQSNAFLFRHRRTQSRKLLCLCYRLFAICPTFSVLILL